MSSARVDVRTLRASTSRTPMYRRAICRMVYCTGPIWIINWSPRTSHRVHSSLPRYVIAPGRHRRVWSSLVHGSFENKEISLELRLKIRTELKHSKLSTVPRNSSSVGRQYAYSTLHRPVAAEQRGKASSRTPISRSLYTYCHAGSGTVSDRQ